MLALDLVKAFRCRLDVLTVVEEEEALYKSRKVEDLKMRIEQAKKGIFDDADEEEEE